MISTPHWTVKQNGVGGQNASLGVFISGEDGA